MGEREDRTEKKGKGKGGDKGRKGYGRGKV